MTNRNEFGRQEPGALAQHVRYQPLKEEEVSALLTSLSVNPALRDLFDAVRIILHTGLRASELCNLRWTDIDLDGSCLHLSRANTMWIARVPLSPAIIWIIRERRERLSRSPFVFGKGQLRRWLHRVLRHLAMISTEIGVPYLTLPRLRRTFVSRIAQP
jgi:integrase